MNRTGAGNRGGGSRGRRRPKRLTDPKNIRVIKCRYCKQPITFSYGSVGRDGDPFPCNLDGTKHVERGGAKK
jgi:hypothetical protein